MSDVKHTPGPWLAEGATVYALNDQDTNRFSAWVQPGHVTTPAASRRTTEAECVANARLIAAAPSLAEALQELLSTTDAKHKLAMLDKGIGTATPDAMWLRARAAISKATGEKA